MAYLDWIFYGNTVRAWAVAVLAALLALAVLRFAQATLLRGLRRLAARTTSDLDEVLTQAVQATRGWVLVVAALAIGSSLLRLPGEVRGLIGHVVVFALLVQIGTWGAVAIRAYVGGQARRRAQEDAASITTIRALGFLAIVLLWSVLLLVALDNVGINITALVAGLGIGGVAVALAVQNILGDLFASLSIVLDKPFVYGDFIVVDDLSGTVENIGLKTTRVRSIAGEQLVFSNSDLLKSRIRNYKRMRERRVVVTLGVVYETSPDELEQIPGMIREIVSGAPDVRFDRSHFRDFGASALNIEFVYYILSPDYGVFMDRQQAINLAIMRRFEAAGIGFAFPSQTIYLAGADAAPRP